MALTTIETNIPSVLERLDAMAVAAKAETTAMLARTAEAIRAVALPALEEATPRRTGELAESSVGEIALAPDMATITLRQTKTVPWKGDAYPLAQFLIGGTAPHDIVPVNARALFWEGADHPVAHVHHPGFPGRDYPSEAIDGAMPAIDAELAAAGDALAVSVVRSLVA